MIERNAEMIANPGCVLRDNGLSQVPWRAHCGTLSHGPTQSGL